MFQIRQRQANCRGYDEERTSGEPSVARGQANELKEENQMLEEALVHKLHKQLQ